MLDTDDHNSSRTTHLSVERMLEGLVGAAMMVATLLRRGLWAPVQLIAAAGLGAAAMMQVRAGGILVGLMTHMMRGVVLALIVVDAFQLLRPGFGPMRLLYGLIAGVVSQFVILPVIDPMMATHMAPGRLPWLISCSARATAAGARDRVAGAGAAAPERGAMDSPGEGRRSHGSC